MACLLNFEDREQQQLANLITDTLPFNENETLTKIYEEFGVTAKEVEECMDAYENQE